jgi:hypothetical protein
MKDRILRFLLVLTFIIRYSDGYSQNAVNIGSNRNKVIDSLSNGLIFRINKGKPDIKLSKEQAIAYLQSRYRTSNWNNPLDPLRQAIGQLIFFSSNNSFDSTRNFFDKYSFDSINIPWYKFYLWDTLKIKIPVIPPPHFTLPSETINRVDTSFKKQFSDSIKPGIVLKIPDFLSQTPRPPVRLKDTIILVAKDTLDEVISTRRGFPFRHYNWPYESDSIAVAINSLISFVENRDSSIVNLSGTSNFVTPVWLNSKSDRLVRFWLRNENSDSVAVWVGSVSRNTLGIFLEEGIFFRRPTKQSNFSNAQLTLKTINSKNLQEFKKVVIKPIYWKLHSETSLILNQASLTNWVKGGESSISTAMDMTGYADYNNKEHKLSSNNFIRLKLGFLKSGENPIRKNIDLLETNSKFNHKAFGKFDFSAIMLIKTQIASGFIYSNSDNSRTLVSKFLNPAVFTFGLGLDYKPDKTTSVNFSPLSYKSTFMTDTVHIDKAKYGIPKSRKSLNEPGVSLMITNEYDPVKTIKIINRLQLFTNYIHNPQNVDVDWEMIATAKINWFTDVRFNTHLIFDDDTKIPVLDKNKKPVLVDGKPKSSARIQFKELLGFTFVFRF